MVASSNPSRSGMHTSMRISAISFFSRHSNAWLAEDAFRRFSPISAKIASWLSNLACWSSTSRMLTRSGAFIIVASAVQLHTQGGQELFDIHRFCEIVGRPRLQALFPVALHGLCGQRQNWQAPELRRRTNRLDGFVALH